MTAKKPSVKDKRVKGALQIVKKAVNVRQQISKLYTEYGKISNSVCKELDIPKAEFKRAVDALYYLGGGWPHPNSKGRLETMLDNFANVLKVLEFVGHGNVVHEYLASKGITVKLAAKHRYKNRPLKLEPHPLFSSPKDLQDLAQQAVTYCMNLQEEICDLADVVKLQLNPDAQKILEIDDPEFDRLFDSMRVRMTGEKAVSRFNGRKKKVVDSVQNFQVAMDIAAQEKLKEKENE